MTIRIIEGLNIPIEGPPEPTLSEATDVDTVAVMGRDYINFSPALQVRVGDRVKLGQTLFLDRKNPEVTCTSPGSGVVQDINRGERRTLLSVVVRLDGDEAEEFASWPEQELSHLSRTQVTEALLASGLWVAFRTRPYSKVPSPESQPHSLFVTATDSNPLAAPPEWIINRYKADYLNGLQIISHLTEGPVFVCESFSENLPQINNERIMTVKFSGPHPSGIVGTHIHYLDPVGANRTVWHLNYQDVIAIGQLFTTGRIWTDRIIALAGPMVKAPRLLRTRLGASIDTITKGELKDGESRVISGSVLSGRWAKGPESYLGRYHNQISVIEETTANPPRDWLGRDPTAYSVFGVQPAGYGYGKQGAQKDHRFQLPFTTALHGRPEAFVPMGGFERVMPLDILPTPLLRALLTGDTDMGQALGCLELDEEDLALCTFVCASKLNYGPMLRAALERIERDG